MFVRTSDGDEPAEVHCRPSYETRIVALESDPDCNRSILSYDIPAGPVAPVIPVSPLAPVGPVDP